MLGHNGAGNTTLNGIVCGLIKASAGLNQGWQRALDALDARLKALPTGPS